MAPKKTYHFISHTHWDREWYLPFERFRYRLVNLIDKLLDLLDRDAAFRHFHLDGQTIVLDDYYALRPGNRDRLERRIREGRILIGPWYQQNDLFLTSAESTVRNLLEGIGASRRLGGEMKVGYLPDHFGLIGQMPQIFRGVGIDNCVFGRGYDLNKHGSPFFRWTAPDGSQVDSSMLYFWYNNAQRLPGDRDELLTLFGHMREREERINVTPHHAMMNGVDHLEAQEDLSAVLDMLRKAYGDEIEFVHDTLPRYMRSVQEYLRGLPDGTVPVVRGELREAEQYNILAGTLSSRVYLKQANVEAHDLLEKWAEPLSVWCAALGLDAYEADTLRYCWKLYMENHPHDSICGCSQDAVHDHMMDRYERLKEVVGEVIQRKLKVLGGQVSAEGYDPADQKLVVFNNAQSEAAEVRTDSVYFPEEDGIEDFAIEDDAGRPVPYRLVRRSRSRRQVLSPINLPGDLRVSRWEIEWQPTVPTLGYATYRIRPSVAGARTTDLAGSAAASLADVVLENDSLRVELQADGTFHLFDKRTGFAAYRQGQIQDAGDCGDLYVFRETANKSYQVWSGAAELVSCVRNALYQECVFRFEWMLPESLDESRKRRSDDTASCPFRIALRLDSGADCLRMNVEIDNRVKDHRIRMLFPGGAPALHVLAGGQYDVVKRSWDSGAEWTRDANAQPFWKWFAPVREEGGLALFAKGLHEYEMLDDGKTAGVTLLRGVETINFREEVYMEQDYQPKGQCPGQHRFALAIRPFREESATRLYREAELFHQGTLSLLVPLDEDRWNKGRTWVQDTAHKGLFKLSDPNARKPRLEPRGSFAKLDGDVMLSAVKWSEDGSCPVVRLYNVEEQAAIASFDPGCLGSRIVAANLLEEPATDGGITPDRADGSFELAAKRIATWRLEGESK